MVVVDLGRRARRLVAVGAAGSTLGRTAAGWSRWTSSRCRRWPGSNSFMAISGRMRSCRSWRRRWAAQPVDLVLSDMAPNKSGVDTVDQPRAMHLAELAMDFADRHLRPGGDVPDQAVPGRGVRRLRARSCGGAMTRSRSASRRRRASVRRRSMRWHRASAQYEVRSIRMYGVPASPRCNHAMSGDRQESMNDLAKNLLLWVVVAVVLMVVFQSFSPTCGRQPALAIYSSSCSRSQQRPRQGGRRSPATSAPINVRAQGRQQGHHLQRRARRGPGQRPDQPQGRDQAGAAGERHRRLGAPAQLPAGAAVHRLLVLHHAADAAGRQQGRDDLRPFARQAAGRGPDQGHLRRRRRLRRGQGRSRRTGRVPARPGQVPEARRQDPARRADGRPARHRQDAARQGHRRRGQGAVLLDLRFRLRRDVRRRRRQPRARHVRAGQEARAVHHLHRRNRRGRPPSRRRPGRRP